MTRDGWRRKHRDVRAQLRRRRPTCHPRQRHLARGLCRACYDRWYRASQALAAAVAEMRTLARGRP